MNYNEAKICFVKARNKAKGLVLPGRLGQTRLVKTEKGFGIKYVNTVVVEILPNENYVLNSGGWRTKTTKERINTYAPVVLTQRKREWYIDGGHSVPFADGIVVNSKGAVVASANTKQVKRIKKMLKKIDTYVDKYMEKLNLNKIPEPSGADCWGCLGIISLNSCLESHLKENYFVPSLLVNAIKSSGYNPSYVNPWNGLRTDNNVFKRALKNYLIKHLAK